MPSNKFAPTLNYPPTKSNLQLSKLLQKIQSSNIQISFNKFKAPTFKLPPTNSKLQHSKSPPTDLNLHPTKFKSSPTCTTSSEYHQQYQDATADEKGEFDEDAEGDDMMA